MLESDIPYDARMWQKQLVVVPQVRHTAVPLNGWQPQPPADLVLCFAAGRGTGCMSYKAVPDTL